LFMVLMLPSNKELAPGNEAAASHTGVHAQVGVARQIFQNANTPTPFQHGACRVGLVTLLPGCALRTKANGSHTDQNPRSETKTPCINPERKTSIRQPDSHAANQYSKPKEIQKAQAHCARHADSTRPSTGVAGDNFSLQHEYRLTTKLTYSWPQLILSCSHNGIHHALILPYRGPQDKSSGSR
jgi:hypothetical protein